MYNKFAYKRRGPSKARDAVSKGKEFSDFERESFRVLPESFSLFKGPMVVC